MGCWYSGIIVMNNLPVVGIGMGTVKKIKLEITDRAWNMEKTRICCFLQYFSCLMAYCTNFMHGRAEKDDMRFGILF